VQCMDSTHIVFKTWSFVWLTLGRKGFNEAACREDGRGSGVMVSRILDFDA
jgi:hypothetical protein